MKVIATDTFAKSLEKLIDSTKWWCYEFWKDKYYDIKWAISNLIKYFKIVTKMRPWDYSCVLEMQKFQVEILCDNIEKYGHEVDESRLLKIDKMKRFLELVHNQREENYAERCGYISGDLEFVVTEDTKDLPDSKKHFEMKSKGKQTDEERRNIFLKAHELEKEEWKEMWEIVHGTGEQDGTDARGWWD
ncbi:hypothetical protein M0Q50_09670 [bacterium]|jgi:hypothetical protein|nr:hypothetical protein [bacterium]